jgi:hypothetical protein
MRRWDGKAVRAYLPAVFALGVAYASSLVLPQWQADPARAGMASLLGWLPYVALAIAAAMGAWVSVRLWRAQYGTGLVCECGGLLGSERRGRRGAWVRRCPACGRQWKRPG